MASTRLAAAVSVALVLMALSGCSALIPASAPAYCVPRMHITPATTHAGDTITVASDDSCVAAVPDGGWVVVAGHIGDGGNSQVQVRTTDMFDGSFRVELPLPEDFPTGEAYAGVNNWDFSRCADTASCAAPMGEFTVER